MTPPFYVTTSSTEAFRPIPLVGQARVRNRTFTMPPGQVLMRLPTPDENLGQFWLVDGDLRAQTKRLVLVDLADVEALRFAYPVVRDQPVPPQRQA